MRKNTIQHQLEKQNQSAYRNNYSNEDEFDLLFPHPSHHPDPLLHNATESFDDLENDSILLAFSRELTNAEAEDVKISNALLNGPLPSNSSRLEHGPSSINVDTNYTRNTNNNTTFTITTTTITTTNNNRTSLIPHNNLLLPTPNVHNDDIMGDDHDTSESSEIELDFESDDEGTTRQHSRPVQHRSGLRLINKNKTANARGVDSLGDENSHSVMKVTHLIKRNIHVDNQTDLKGSIFNNNTTGADKTNPSRGRSKLQQFHNGSLRQNPAADSNHPLLFQDPFSTQRGPGVKSALGAFSETNSNLFARFQSNKEDEAHDTTKAPSSDGVEERQRDQETLVEGGHDDDDDDDDTLFDPTPHHLPLLPSSGTTNRDQNNHIGDSIVAANVGMIKTMIREARQLQRQNRTADDAQLSSKDPLLPASTPLLNPKALQNQPTALAPQERSRIAALRRVEERKNGLLEWRVLVNHMRSEYELIERIVFDHHINPHVINRDRLGGYDACDGDQGGDGDMGSDGDGGDDRARAKKKNSKTRESMLSLGNWDRDRYNKTTNGDGDDDDDVVVTTVRRRTRGEIKQLRESGKDRNVGGHDDDDDGKRNGVALDSKQNRGGDGDGIELRHSRRFTSQHGQEVSNETENCDHGDEISNDDEEDDGGTRGKASTIGKKSKPSRSKTMSKTKTKPKDGYLTIQNANKDVHGDSKLSNTRKTPKRIVVELNSEED